MDQVRLKQLLTYHPDLGAFTWNESRGASKAGTTTRSTQISLEGVAYSATRLAWLYSTGEWPATRIKYRNGNSDDIRWGNLYSNAPLDGPLDAETLQTLLDYNPDTGVFTWLMPTGKPKSGDIAGSPNSRGYIHVQIAKKLYKAHRLAWLYMTGEWPTSLVDHEDTDRQNNRWGNLRLATPGQNRCNAKVNKDSRSGIKGVKRIPSGNQIAALRINGKFTHLGTFDTPEAAEEAARAAREQHHGEFARH